MMGMRGSIDRSVLRQPAADAEYVDDDIPAPKAQQSKNKR